MRDLLLVVAGLAYILGYAVWAIQAYNNDLGMLPALDAQYFVAGIISLSIICLVWLGIKHEETLEELVTDRIRFHMDKLKIKVFLPVLGVLAVIAYIWLVYPKIP